jgi:glycopeptide antibiotics resistance protein
MKNLTTFLSFLSLIVAIIGVLFYSWWGLWGIALIATGLFRFCLLCLPFNISTAKEENL